MLKKLLSTLLFFFLVISPSLVVGQDMPPGKWWKDPQVVEKLDLDDSQISKLDDTYLKSRRQLIKLKSAAESERLELEQIFDRKSIDDNAVKTQYQKVEEAQCALGAERFQFIMKVRKIIGYEKFNKLKTMFVQFHKNRFQNKSGRFGPKK